MEEVEEAEESMLNNTPENNDTLPMVRQVTPILPAHNTLDSAIPETPHAANLPKLLIEVFPINTTLPSLHKLVAYQLEAPESEQALIGGKLAYRCNETLPGHWLWTEHRLITDTPLSHEQMKKYLATLWQTLPESYSGLCAIRQDDHWQVTAQAQSNYVARCLCTEPELQEKIRAALQPYHEKLNKQMHVQRVPEIRGRPVQGQPALSISISSRVLTHLDLKMYAQQFTNPDELIGTPVIDKRKGYKGEIISVYSERVAAHRERLLGLTPNEQSRDTIRNAPDDELVVRIRPYKGSAGKQPGEGYDYVISALQVTMKIEEASRFGITAQSVLGALRLSPERRTAMVKSVSKCLRGHKLIEGAFNSDDHADLFLQATDYSYSPTVLLGRNHRVHGEIIQREDLRCYGFYHRSETCPKDAPIRVGVLSGILSPQRRPFWDSLQKECRAYGFELQPVKAVTCLDLSRHHLERAIEQLQKHQPHIVLALFPDKGKKQQGDAVDCYHNFKALTVGREIASQVVYAKTLSNNQALVNIALGFLSKLGNIPFRLAEPLPYADIIVGLDISRSQKTRLAGSMNAVATAQIYQDEHATLKYYVQDALLEGETIPDRALQSFFPSTTFAGKRVLVHRDGWFRGNERQALKTWAQKIGATFYFVEIVKSGVPRFYRWLRLAEEQRTSESVQQPIQMHQPPKGSAFRLSDQEAFLVSSLPPFLGVTPYPLYIRAEAPLRIEDALHSVLTLTLLHYGSVRSPRLPVTTYYSDKMAYLALQGIRPHTLEGTLPYWI